MKFGTLDFSPALRRLFTVLGGLVALASGLAAQTTLASWEFAGYNAVDYNLLDATTLGANIGAASLTLGPGLNGTSTANTFTAGGFDNNSLGDAIGNDEYFSFTVTPASGASFTPTLLSGRFRAGTPAHAALYSSAGGFNEGAEIWTGNIAGGFINSNFSIDLSSAFGAGALTEATEFRFYAYRDSADAQTIGLTARDGVDDLVLAGTTATAAVPEPSTYAALAGATALTVSAWRRRAGRKSARGC